MGIAMTLKQYLEDQHVAYGVTHHPETDSSSRTAEASHIPGDQIAKGVVLKSGDVFMLAVLPASRHVELDLISEIIDAPVELASEIEASILFPDCSPGAVPALAVPYKIAGLVDEELEGRADVYFEGGDHRTLVHLNGEQFTQLMYGIPHGHFSN